MVLGQDTCDSADPDLVIRKQRVQQVQKGCQVIFMVQCPLAVPAGVQQTLESVQPLGLFSIVGSAVIRTSVVSRYVNDGSSSPPVDGEREQHSR